MLGEDGMMKKGAKKKKKKEERRRRDDERTCGWGGNKRARQGNGFVLEGRSERMIIRKRKKWFG